MKWLVPVVLVLSLGLLQLYGRPSGLVVRGGQTYLLDESGKKLTGIQTIEDKTYYFDEDTGQLVSGWVSTNAGRSYFDASGTRYVGKHKIDGQVHHFDEKGLLMTSCFVQLDNGKYVWVDEEGIQQKGEYALTGPLYEPDVKAAAAFDSSVVKKDVKAILDQYGGNVSVYFKDLQSQQGFEINPQAMYPCCMIKIPVMMTFFDEADKKHLVYEDHVSDLELLMIRSDNTAMNRLIRAIGQGDAMDGLKKINAHMQKMGVQETEIHRSVHPSLGAFTDGGDNIASPADIGLLLEKLYRQDGMSKIAQSRMLSLMKRCGDIFALMQGVHWGTTFAHKTGCALSWYHDGGIGFMEEGDFILVVFTEGIPGQVGSIMGNIMDTVQNHLYEQADR